jgi:hypothetical protein
VLIGIGGIGGPQYYLDRAAGLRGALEQQVKGLSKQISGKVQKDVGDLKQSVEDFNKS